MIPHEVVLILRREHHHREPVAGVTERGEHPTSNAKVGVPLMRALHGFRQT